MPTRPARGGFGLITLESTVVCREAKGGPRKACLFSDRSVERFRRVADLLGHSTSEITELYYVKKDTGRLAGITAGFEL